MKKSYKIIIVLVVLLSIITTNLSGCSKKDEANSFEIFDMPSTVKVLRDEDYSKNYTQTPSLNYESAKNEYESMQLIINAKRDVKFYKLEVDNLKSDTNIISKDNIKVYAQRYIEVLRNTPSRVPFPKGFYPDALIPMETSLQYNENNFKGGANQGIWITIFTPQSAVAGDYTSAFTLTLDDEVYSIPVKLKVWDFEISTETHVKTVFTTTQEWLVNGELDNTDKMYEKYIDSLSEYRMSTIDVPHANELDSFIKYAKKYTLDKRHTAYQLYIDYVTLNKNEFPAKPNGESYGAAEDESITYSMLSFEETKFTQYIKAMIENSTPDMNLFDKVVCYPGSLDESHARGMQANCKYFSNRMIDVLITIADDYTTAQLESYGLTRKDIVEMDMLFTIPYSADTAGMRGYCPLIVDYLTDYERDNYKQMAKETYKGYNNSVEDGGNIWWYFCNNPKEPFPTFQMDANLIGGRVMPWMMYNYGIEGVLNWGTSVYVDVGTGSKSKDYFETRHPYNDCEVFWDGQGDGYFVYPGAKYGIEGPLPSIRLMAFRDGIEDYEFLYALGQQEEKYKQKYGKDDLNFNTALQSIYDILYTDIKQNTDYNNVYEARRQVASLLELITSEAHAFLEVESFDIANQQAVINVFAENGTVLKVNNEPISSIASGQGLKFTYRLNLDKNSNFFNATLENNGQKLKITKFISNSIGLISNFENINDLAKWHVYKDGEKNNVRLSVDGNENKHLKVEIDKNDSDNIFYNAGFGISKIDALGDTKMTDIDKIEFDITNLSSYEVNLNIIFETKLSSASATKQNIIKSISLAKGKNHIVIPKISELKIGAEGNLLDNVVGISFKVTNSSKTNTLLLVDDIFYSNAFKEAK